MINSISRQIDQNGLIMNKLGLGKLKVNIVRLRRI